MLNQQIIVNNLRINYYRSEDFSPNNNTFVFLHGWKSESLHLKTIFDNISNYLALDLPGFGGSALPKEVWGVGEYVIFLKNFLEKIGIKNPILVGHSFGGAIIIKFLAIGNRAQKAILIDSAGIRKNGFKIQVYKIIAKIFKLPFFLPGLGIIKSKIRRGFYKLIDSEDYIGAGELTESYKKIIREDLRQEMQKINSPVYLIWGEDDKATEIKDAYLIKSFIKNSQLTIIKNAGHFPFLDCPKEFRSIFLDIVKD